VIHSYRHRYGLVPGDPNYAPLEERLSTRPDIEVSTVVMISEGGLRQNLAPDTSRLPGLIAQLRIDGGHNMIQENPAQVVAAFRLLRDREITPHSRNRPS
jgi:hypothetical protein